VVLDDMDSEIKQVVMAGLIAGVVSGLPSTGYALLRGDDPLESTLAIGSLVTKSDDERVLVAAALPVHLAASLWWAVLLTYALPDRKRSLMGGFAGVAIALFDLRVVGRMFPRIHRLSLGAQIADHAAFGAIVGALTRRPS
jgi:hypothetical protein